MGANRELDLVYFVWCGSFPDLSTTYREVAEAGVRSIVLTETRAQYDLKQADQAREAGRLFTDLGLATPACHGLDAPAHILNVPDEAHRAAMVRDHANLMTNVAALGARTYVLHLGPRPVEAEVPAAWDAVRRALDQLAPRAAELGLLLALENGLPGYQATNEELLALVADYAHPAVGICYDSGHANVTADAAAVLRAFSPHVVTVHLHDNDGNGDQHLLPEQGSIAWPGVVAALNDCPRLVHAETEAANCPQWPPAHDFLSHCDAYALYRRVLNPPDAVVTYR